VGLVRRGGDTGDTTHCPLPMIIVSGWLPRVLALWATAAAPGCMGWLTWVGAGQVEPGGEADCRIDLDGGLPQVLSVREQQKRLHHLRAAARVAQQRDRARTVELQPLHCQAEGRGQRAEGRGQRAVLSAVAARCLKQSYSPTLAGYIPYNPISAPHSKYHSTKYHTDRLPIPFLSHSNQVDLVTHRPV
jgi:hypothetical protein